MRCRHTKTWLICGAHAEWCYECGAIRRLVHVEGNACKPFGKWAKPTGKGGENPYKAWSNE